MIAWNCPKCAAKLNVDDQYAGKPAACPKCQAAMTVPEVAKAEERSMPPVRDQRPTVLEPEEPRRERYGRDEDRGSNAHANWLLEALRITGIVAWTCVVVITPICGITFITSLNRARTVWDEAATGATTSATLIGLYVFARGVDEMRKSLIRQVG